MKKIYFNDIFNEDTLNIFTDASIWKDANGYTLSAPGAVCVITKNEQTYVLEMDCGENNIICNSTNNEGEITAISLGIFYAIKYKDKFKNINLFSDSNICIQGLKNWIFNWVNCFHNGKMISSSGTPVANQDIISSIVNTIIDYELNINLYHQKGHVDINNETLMKKAYKDFITTNNIKASIERDIISCISFYNDLVDKETKKSLVRYKNNYIVFDTQKPISFTPHKNRIGFYKKLIGV